MNNDRFGNGMSGQYGERGERWRDDERGRGQQGSQGHGSWGDQDRSGRQQREMGGWERGAGLQSVDDVSPQDRDRGERYEGRMGGYSGGIYGGDRDGYRNGYRNDQPRRDEGSYGDRAHGAGSYAGPGGSYGGRDMGGSRGGQGMAGGSYGGQVWTGERWARPGQQGWGDERGGQGWGSDRWGQQARDWGQWDGERQGQQGRGQGGMNAGQGGMGQQSFRGRGPRGYTRSDERIREDVNDCLTQHHDIDASSIEVQVKDGEVTLTGTVDERVLKYTVEHAVDGVMGVKEIHNQLRVKRQGAETGARGGSTDTAQTGSTNGPSTSKGASRNGSTSIETSR